MTADTDALLATVRDRLLALGDHMSLSREEGLAALAALAAGLQERDQRIRELEADPDRPNVTYAGDELEAAEAELERVKIERDEAHLALSKIGWKKQPYWMPGSGSAEARLDEALAALRKLRDATEWESEADGRAVRQIARAAIAEIEGEA
jgi:hypothetical protein